MNQYNKVPHLTQNTKLVNDKTHTKHHTQENQEVSPAGDQRAARNSQDRQDSITKTNIKHK